MKILWSSNSPWTQTGYGVQTRLFTPRIKRLGHDVAILCYYGLQGGVLNMDGIQMYPKLLDDYGNDALNAHASNFGAQIIITLTDAWVVNPMGIQPSIKWTPWFPVDSDPVPPLVLRNVSSAHERIVFSKYAKSEMDRVGLTSYYVPHGVDTKEYHPLDSQEEARKIYGLPTDRYIVGLIAMNKGFPPRKCWPQQIEGFARFHAKHPEAVLYLHTLLADHGEMGGMPIRELIRYNGLELGKDVLVTDPYTVLMGIPPDRMNALYNSFDVLLSVSAGEGFGVPILEAQAAGTPVIVGDWTAMGELCFAGWKVAKKEALKDWTAQNTYQYNPDPQAIADRLECAYKQSGNLGLRKQARAGAEAYDVEKITQEYWKPTLEAIEAGLPK